MYKRQVYNKQTAPLVAYYGGRGTLVTIDGMADIADVTGPVSYTHLRAHGTVLDLVCRLLLEKKKAEYNSRFHICRSTQQDHRYIQAQIATTNCLRPHTPA